METFKAPEIEIINPNVSPEIEGDNSISYENWKAYEKAVEEGIEESPKEIVPKKHERYEFNVDKALDCIDLTFNGYTPSRDAIEFFNIMRLVYGEDFETDNALMHYFLVDLVYGNIKRENFPYSQEINEKIRLNSKKIAIIASRFSAKALTLDSKVITPTGYTTIKDVKIGDVVLDRDGKKCNVIAKSPIFNKPVYKMTLLDGRVIKMSDDHKCIVWKRKREMVAGKNRCKNNCPSGYTEVVMTAKELYESGVKTNRTPKKDGYSENDYKYWVPMMGLSESTIEYDSNDYGFDAYTTGVILGDGSTCKDTGYTRITAHKDDMFEYEKYIPYNFGKITKKYVNGIEQNAVMFGLVGMGKSIKKWIGDERSYTKRVPEKLMNGSMFQRLEVLKGLMDTDGTVYKNGYCSFTSTSKGLAEDVQYLVQSLGGSAFVTESDTESEFGKAWSARIKINRIIFKLKRKVNRQVFRESYMRNPIESIEIIDNETTQCISVSSPTHSFLTDGHTVTHNSTIITAFMPIVTAITGKMPNFGDVMFWVSFGDSQQAGAKVQANTIRDICEDSLFCKDYFEKMRFTDEECEFIRKDDPKNPLPIKKRCFMFKVKGAAGGSVRGIRYKTERPQIFSFDDIIKSEADACSPIIMKKLVSMIYSDAENALGKKGKIIIVNTPFNKKDPVYTALENGVWTPVCLPVCEKIYLDMPKSEYRGSWEAMKPYEEIMEKYEDAYYGDTLREFNQELMLRISSEEDKLIPDKLLESQWYKRTDILKNLYAYNLYMTTDFTTTGNKGSDLSGIAVWAVNHNQDWFMLDLCLRKQEVEQQYNEVFRFIDTYTPENKTFEVGAEVDGNQRSHIHALKDRMRQRMNYFTIARQRGSQPGAEGILSRLEGGNKHWRMRMMLPMFQNRKIFFPEELRHSPDMVELMDEIRYTSYTRFNSKHDDGMDLLSMINALEVIYPAKNMSYIPTKIKDGKVAADDIYGMINRHSDEEYSAYDSY